ncbi:MAG: 4Fe-4S binding protein [Sedimentisphaerales bacterium]|nr:4Fe-4S binding protein [Sedimentisphaerales bacterium]
MSLRNVVKIDETKCTGCGLCVTACAEGAIQIVNGKARLISETYCDGLGACLGHCPEGAITVERREAADFDEQAVKTRLEHQSKPDVESLFVCPGMAAQRLTQSEPPGQDGPAEVPSQLGQWPVQLRLVSPTASYFADSDLLLVADCVPFAVGDFHPRFLRDRSVAVGCPKLDDVQLYVDKLAQILRANNLHSLTVVHMEVPCCSGLTRVAREAMALSGKPLHFQDVTISLHGEAIQTETISIRQVDEIRMVKHG